MQVENATVGGPALTARTENAEDLKDVPLSLTLGEVEYVRARLRELTAGDILDAQEASEKVVQQRDGSLALVGSPAAMGRELLRRRVACLHGAGGERHLGPLSAAELGRMSPEDLHAVQTAADTLDMLAGMRAGEKIASRGRNAGGGGEAAQGGPLPVSYGHISDDGDGTVPVPPARTDSGGGKS